jgi:uncharacterized membrane protein required for colicin V production
MVMSNAFHIVDIIAIVALFLGVVQGYFRGLSGELSRLICILAALYTGLRCHTPFTEWILAHTRVDPQYAGLFSFVALMVGMAIALTLVSRILKRVIKVIVDEDMDRFLGMAAGAVRMAFLITIAFLLMILIPSETTLRMFGQESRIGQQVIKLLPIVEKMIDSVGDPAAEPDEPTAAPEPTPN